MDTYVTTYCNFPHNLDTGRPVDHECYILPPAALAAERAGDVDKAVEILSRSDFKRRGTVFGRRSPLRADVGNVYDKPNKYNKKFGLHLTTVQDATKTQPSIRLVTFDGGDRAVPFGAVKKFPNRHSIHILVFSPGHSGDLSHAVEVATSDTLDEALQFLTDHRFQNPYPNMGR